MGGAPLCSIARGKQETLLAEKIMGTTCFMLLVTAGLLTVLGALLAKPLLFWFGASADTYPLCVCIFFCVHLGDARCHAEPWYEWICQ